MVYVKHLKQYVAHIVILKHHYKRWNNEGFFFLNIVHTDTRMKVQILDSSAYYVRNLGKLFNLNMPGSHVKWK